MSRISYKEFEDGTKSANVFEIEIGKIILVEDPKIGGYTSFFKPELNMVSQGETQEEAVENLLLTYINVLNSKNMKLNPKKILSK